MAKTRPSRSSVAGSQALRDRLVELEVRLAAVEAHLDEKLNVNEPQTAPDGKGSDDAEAVLASASPTTPIPFTPADLRARLGKPGGVLLTGTTRLPRNVRATWQREASTAELLDADWTAAGDAIAALAHPVRLALLREVLRGARTVAALASLPNSGTTGQLYHHLRPLVAEGWLQSAGRGRYEVPEERIIPLLAIITAIRGGRVPQPAPAPVPTVPVQP